MAMFFDILLLILARSSRDELIEKILFLKVENENLRTRSPKRITVTPAERARLLKFGKPLGSSINELISIVHPRTFARWVAAEKNGPDKKVPRRKPGRPRTKQEIRETILRMAAENPWGLTRIWGELRKLKYRVGRTTIQNILVQAGFDPNPNRARSTWKQFIERHAQTLWAVDFLQVKSLTLFGKRDLFLMAFIHVGSRRVWVSPSTAHPDGAWVAQQARNFCMHVQDQGMSITHLLRDRDTKFTGLFDTILETEGANVRRLPIMSPNLNAYIERWIQSCKHECLRHFLIFGERHLDYLVSEYVAYYHEERPHQGIGNVLLSIPQDDPPNDGEIQCKERLGGLLKHYHRQAA